MARKISCSRTAQVSRETGTIPERNSIEKQVHYFLDNVYRASLECGQFVGWGKSTRNFLYPVYVDLENATMRVIRFVFVLSLFFIVSATLMYGQGGANGTILGTVIDSSGAVVANAQVDVTNVATGVVSRTSTGANGDFTSPYLAPGIYSVTVQAQGFQKAVADNITLAVAQQARVNVTMKPGQVSETVQVEASSVLWIPIARRSHNWSARNKWRSCPSMAATS